MWTIRKSTKDHKGREGKLKGKKPERETKHKRLFKKRFYFIYMTETERTSRGDGRQREREEQTHRRAGT